MSELDLVKSPSPKLVETLAAVKRGDVAGARAALTSYDLIWNGIEVYVSFRSRDLYLEVEAGYQKKIEELLAAPTPDLKEIASQLEAMIASYDKAIKNSETGPALSPLFDDVAKIRIARTGLRVANPALQAGDGAKAHGGFGDFKKEWPSVEGLYKSRDAVIHGEVGTAIAQIDQAF